MRGPQRANFLPPATTLVGRHGELRSIDDALRRRRLVTLVGPPGVGKSRLAIEYGLGRADELSEAGGGGVWFCDLTQAATLSGICRGVSRVVEVALTSDRTPAETVERLASALAARGPILLILDNFERASRYATQVLVPWLHATSEALFLVTSRTRTGLDEEAVVELGPLGLPGSGASTKGEALQLLVERTQALRPDFAPSEREMPLLAELVRRLDGLPFAIELAAARLGVLGPKQLLKRIESGLDVLAAPRAGGHGTLRAMLDWSWDLLEPHERTALAQLSVFPESFSAEAAEWVVDLSAHPGAPPPLDVLQSLRDQSLLHLTRAAELPEEVRFELLQIVRTYAEEKLSQGGAELVHVRHAKAFLVAGRGWAQDVDRGDGPEALARLAVELPNLVAVHRRALSGSTVEDACRALEAVLALEPVFYMRGPTELCLSMSTEALAAAAHHEVPPRLLALALKARARACRDAGRFDESETDLARALEAAKASGDRSIEGRVLGHVGFSRQARGQHAAALEPLGRALEHLRAARDARSEGMLLAALGQSLGELGRFDEATASFDEAMRRHREVGNRYAAAFVAASRAKVARAQGRLESARLDLERGIGEYEAFQERRHEGMALTELAAVLQEQGRLAEARDACDRAATCHRAFGSRLLESVAIGQLGDIEREDGRLEGARTCYTEATAIAREVSDAESTARWLIALGSVEAELGRPTVGRALIDEGEALRTSDHADHVAHVALHRGLVALSDARDAAEAALAQARAVGAPVGGQPPHVALGFRLLERQLLAPDAASSPPPPSNAGPSDLVVAASGRWFRLPDGTTVSLQRRQALRLVLSRLVESRQARPGNALSPAEILEAGWPGEKVRPQAGLLRVYNALSTLRRMGLRDSLLSRDDGYLIDPAVSVARVDDAPS